MAWTELKYMGMGWYVSVNTETYEEAWSSISYEPSFNQTVAKTEEEFVERMKLLGVKFW